MLIFGVILVFCSSFVVDAAKTNGIVVIINGVSVAFFGDAFEIVFDNVGPNSVENVLMNDAVP